MAIKQIIQVKTELVDKKPDNDNNKAQKQPAIHDKLNKQVVITDTPEVLNTKCSYIKEITPEIKELAKDMLETVRLPENNAAGLSAPQVGVPIRMCVVRKFRENPQDPEEEIVTEQVLINPKITSEAPQTDIRWEGCLSIPDIFGLVERPKRVKVTALDENGNEIRIKASGFYARVIQHEIDHLNGILYSDKVVGHLITEPQLDKLIEEEHREL